MREMNRMGITAIKLNLSSNRGWPDRMLILPKGAVLFIEFKCPGETPKSMQLFRHKKLRGLGHDVKTFDDAEEAIAYVIQALAR